MKRSEKRLLGAFGLVVFALVNLFGFRILREKKDAADIEAGQLRDQIGLLSLEEAERDLWLKRRAWMESRQPAFTDETTEAPKLEGAVTNAANLAGVSVDSLKPVALESTDNFDKIGIVAAVSGSNEEVVRFLSLLQTRDGFRTMDSFELKPDKKDPAIVKCAIVLSQLYAKGSVAQN